MADNESRIDPIAVVGMGCRYPRTISSPGELWDFVSRGDSAATPGFPADRGWNLPALTSADPEAPGSTYVRAGSFVDGAGDFDSAFFGISPREALAMDPQQRILLQISWEALERAGIDPTTLAGTPAGVYFGVVAQEYGPRVFTGDLEHAGHLTTGTTPSVASGRVAYALGLQGPAVTVDTACSSSLSAIHLAVRALRAGECSVALAGGANVVCAPSIFVGFGHLGALAPDGLSKPFSAQADGFGVSEGAGVLVLERLSEAERNGHEVLAVLRGSAIGQDGASDGLSAPSEAGQRRVIRDALADAGLSAADVDVVEAHGTGTRVGDPIEARALLATYGAARSAERPLLVGSLKSNIGHPQAAAGVAGIIKMVEAIRHAEVPGTLHLTAVTEAVDWSPGTVRVVGEATSWPAGADAERPRRAAVSSFGISGTNAHVIVEQAPPKEPEPQAGEPEVVPLVLSAKSPDALQAQAMNLFEFLAERPDLRLADVAHTLTTARADLTHRAVVVAGGRTEALDGLRALAEGRPGDTTVTGRAEADGEVVFVFPGQGSQWTEMAAELLVSSPVFAAEIEACDRAFAEFVDWSLLDVLRCRPGAPGLDRVDVVQPALFAVMVSLARCWQALGVRPGAVIGHSQGEIAAAHVAGILSLADAARIVTLRSKAIVAIAGTGGMASVALGADEVADRLRRWPGRLGIATINGPRAIVVSGDDAAIDEFVRECTAEDIRVRRIAVDYASHSAHVDHLGEELHQLISGIRPSRSDVEFISTVTGEPADGTDLDAGYWFRNLRRTVDFCSAVRTAHGRGYRLFIEVSPHPVLAAGIEDSLSAEGTDPTVVTGTLRRDEGGLHRLLTSAAEAHVAGAPLALGGHLGGSLPRLTQLPTYPFEGRRFWMSPEPDAPAAARQTGSQAVRHLLLDTVHDHPEREELQFTGRLSLQTHPWMADHAVHGVVLLPGAALVELALFAGQHAGCPAVTELVLQEPLIIGEHDAVLLQVVVSGEESDGERGVRIYSRSESDQSAWTRHAEGTLGAQPAGEPVHRAAWPPADAEPVDVSDAYDRLAGRGYEYGPAFRGLRAVWRRGTDVYAEVALPDGTDGADLHPALLDSALHALEYTGADREVTAEQVRLPFAWAGVSLRAVGATMLRVHIRETGPDTYRLSLSDSDGEPVCTVSSLRLRPISRQRLLAAVSGTDDMLFGVDWTPVGTPGTAPDWHEWPTVSESGTAGLVVLRCADRVADTDGSPGSDLPLRARQAADDTLHVAQRVLTDSRFDGATLVVLTRRAVSTGAGEDVESLAHAPVWGLLRSAQTEHPGRIVLVDLDEWVRWPESVDTAVAAGEPQVAIRRGVALAPRVVRRTGTALAGTDLLAGTDWRLGTLGGGTLDAANLAITAWPEAGRPLAPGEVRVAVHAVGLNFRDVMIGLGLYPDPDVDLGNEGAGVVVEVAGDVRALRPGDRVMGMFSGIGPRVVRDHRFFTRVPSDWSFEQAATTPAVFLTAYHALRELAGITRGQRLLVHAATGGVGLAAIQLARHLGAETFVTAHPAKWSVLRDLGFDAGHTASSRTPEFRDTFLGTTGGAGVDVVLNSLAGELVDASLDLLPRGGHFIELGKTDPRDPQQIAEQHPGVRYQHFDLTRVGPEETARMLAELGTLFDRGDLRPLPVSARDLRQAPEALTFLSKARHTGKLALTLPTRLNPAGTVLITGGTGVLGAMLARHLVTGHQVKHLLLLSRSGPDAADAGRLDADLRAAGADVRIVGCDAADPAALAAALAQVPAEHPLTAVVHAAGFLDDGLFAAMTPARLDRALRPKLDAAWNLHQATRHLDLSAFVLFSSAAGILGTGGQANYAAANTFLDALAEHRHQLGLSATSLAWGLWETRTGMTGHLGDQDHARLRRTGFSPLSRQDGLALFDAALRSGESLLLPARLDLSAARGSGGILGGSARPARRVAGRGSAEPAAAPADDDLAALPVAERTTAILVLVREVAATVLGHDSAEAIDPATSFKDLGFDSLGAVDFRNRLKKASGLALSSTAVFDHKTPAALTEHLAGRSGPTGPAPAHDPEPAPDPAPVHDRESVRNAERPAGPVALNRYQQDIVTTGLTYPGLPLSQPSGYVRLHGTADVDRMREALRLTAARHDAMRLRLDVTGDEMRQRVLPDFPAAEVVSFLDAPDPRLACQEWISRTTDEVVALDGPLVQTTILIDDPGSLILYCRIHHAVADAWGITLMLREVCGYYRTGDPAGPTPPSCLDVVTEDQRYRASPQWRADRDALVRSAVELTPALFPRTATVRDHHRRQQSAHVPAPVADRVRATGRSVFAVTAAAVAAYLRRVHRDGDIVLGVPLLNRRTPEELATMSDVTNILPLPVPVDEQGTLLDLADRIRADVWDLTGHQRFAMGDLLAALREQGPRSPSLFDVTYSYIAVPDDGSEQLTDAELTVLASGYSLDAVNIVVREHEADGSLDVDVFSADDVFDEDFSIEAATRHVLTLLDRGLREPGASLGELSVLAPDETEQIAGFERPYPAGRDESATLDRLVAAQARRTLDRPAVLGDGIALTYAQFAARVDGLAGQLRGLGLRPQECVPVILPRSVEYLIAVHAVHAAGGAYVPIDPEHPEQRVRTVLADCGARFALTGDAHAGLVDELGIGLVREPELAEPAGPATTRPGDLAYVIYTSGSTGAPKGVMIEHRSVVNRLEWMQRRYPLGQSDVVLHKTPASFDVSVWELMWWAHTGASVAVAPAGAERDPRELVAAVERYDVTVVHFVPSMLGPFLDHLAADPRAAARITTLRRVFCSGEALTPALARRFRETFAAAGHPGVDLVNLYGPTEATVDVSSFDVPRTGEIARVPIGRPIDNTALLVLDRAGRRCPVGVPGELNIAGAGVGRGYLGQPARTAEVFIDDESIPERRRYRTGDLARWLADGTVEYLGRLDDQVKIRGNRVTLGEVENALTSCPDVAAAAVTDRDTDAGTSLVAYIVADGNPAWGDRSSLVEPVVDYLADRLPSYMVPADFVRLAELPLTRSGKVDRRALPAPERNWHASATPGSAAERELAAIWRDVLGSDGFGVHDDFFTIGGDSILVLRMRAEAEKRGLPFDLDRFRAHPTIAGLAELAADRHPRPAGTAVTEPFQLVPLIDRAGLDVAEDAFPATQLQLGMLFHSLQRADSPLYKDVFRYRLRMPWDENEFRQAYQRLVRRQPALRSNFDLTGRSTPLQVVLPAVPDTLSIGAGDDTAVSAYLQEMQRTGYPLIDDRPGNPAALHGLRVFVRTDGVDLVVHFHHAILDGWSVATLISDLLRDYLVRLGADLPPIEPEPASALLLAEHVRAEHTARADRAAGEFWANEVRDSRPTTIEPVRAHVGEASAEDGRATVALPSWLDRCVRQFARQQGVPMKSLLLTAHCLTLRAMSGSDDVVTGCVTHARPERAGADRIAGLFLNTVPVRLNGRQHTWREALDRVVAWERESFPHRRFPVSTIVAEHGGPVFETAFNFVDYHIFDAVFGAGRAELVDVAVREETNFALLTTALVDPRDGRISLRVSADEAGLTAAQCARFGWMFVRILEELVRRPDGVIDLAAASRRNVTDLVAEVASRFPGYPAVEDGAERWDYRRLSDTADNVALQLLGQGMPAGSRVVVRMERSIELVAIVLGVLRAGAAVVPLDPSYPTARLQAMVEIAAPYRIVVEPGELFAEPEEATALPAIDPEDIAYVLFTSGSTGEPKGVALPHRALTNLIEWQDGRPTGGSGLRTLQFAPLSFDVSFQEIFSTLCAGGTLRVIAEQVHRDLGAVLKVLDEDRINRIYLPYVALQALAEVAAATGTYPASLGLIVSSGEQLRITPEIRALCAANPGTVLENQYGPTETHVVLAHQLPAAPDDHPALPPVGRPISGTTVELLDDRLQPVLPGVPGELYVSGPCVAQGYEQRPGLTAQRFVAGPAGAVRYRTGDIGVVLAGGEIVCLGRADGQVKVRGFRVECAEIELAVLALGAERPGIAQVAVVPRELGGGDAMLHAFLTGDPGRIEIETVRRELARVLPPHMVPARYQWIDAMPLTPSGKRDDAALRKLESTGGDTAEPSGDELTDTIAAMLAEFAQVDEVSSDTSFFDAGGTSIGATRVSMTIARRWGVELPLQTFIAAPTARQLAGLVRSHDTDRGFDPVVALREPGDRQEDPLFLVHPIGGTVLCYRELAARLPGDRAVFGLQAAGAVPGTTALASMESLAASYLAAIRRVHPSGPIHLAGWSFGGYAALEMARQLADHEVATLTLLDTIALNDGPRPALDEKQLITLFFRELLWSSVGSAADGDGDPAASSPEELFDAVFRRTVELGIMPVDGSPHLLRRLYRVFRGNYLATVNYRIGEVHPRLLVLRAAEALPAGLAAAHRRAGSMFDSPGNGWEHWAGRPVETVEVPGNHLSMMDVPQVGVVAAELGAALARTAAGVPS